MKDSMTIVGLDVHKNFTEVAFAETRGTKGSKSPKWSILGSSDP